MLAPSRFFEGTLYEGKVWPGQRCSGCGEVYGPARWEEVLACERRMEQGVRALEAGGAGGAGGEALMQEAAGCLGAAHWCLQELRLLRVDGFLDEANAMGPVRSHSIIEMEAFSM